MHNTCVQSVRSTWGYVITKSVQLFTAVQLLCSTSILLLVQLVSCKQYVRRLTSGLYAGKNTISYLLNLFFTHNPQSLLLSRKGI